MYTKEQIIEEIKRIADKLGVKSLKKKDFDQHSTIPSSTFRFYMGSWERAVKEAGLEPEMPGDNKSKREPRDNDELLLELNRLYDVYGETPTAALVESKGKYPYQQYSSRWKSLAEAFELARKKFMKKNNVPHLQKPEQEKVTPEAREVEAVPPMDKSEKIETDQSLLDKPLDLGDLGETVETVPSNLDDFSDLGISPLHAYDEEKEDGVEEVQLSPDVTEKPIDINRAEKMPKGGDKMTEGQKIKLIPQTIKPKIAKKKPKVLGEPIHFRGLKFAPVNEKSVAYLFGMISHELGFIIEALRTESPDCEGKRCLDTTRNKWEQVKIDFEYKSSDFEAQGHNETETDIIVCWIHDWDECPLEVLELRSTIELLNDTNRS
jgi:hypothetical protein